VGDEHSCALYCAPPVHAVVITVHGGKTADVFERYARACGCVFHGAKQVYEVDLRQELAKRTETWNAVTGAWTVYEATESGPTDEVWLVWLAASPPCAVPESWWQTLHRRVGARVQGWWG
jgi:hypothetical protein